VLFITKRIAAVTVTVSAIAAGLVLNGPVAALAATAPSSYLAGATTTHSGCFAGLMSARLSASTPADVAAEVESEHPGHTCTGFVERSSNGGKTWSVASAKVALPSVSGLEGFANTGLVYDGPGYKARACAQPAGSKSVYCTSATTLAKGGGTATSPALPPSYLRKEALVSRVSSTSSGVCVGELASTTTTKRAGASVDGIIFAVADPCTAWVQSSTNKGKTWTTVSPVQASPAGNASTTIIAFTARYADAPGHLARLCVKDMTSKKLNCSGSW
jgi:hypothetical protein